MDYQQLKGQQVFFNTLVGGYCAYKFQPMHAEAALSYPLFRKRWMRYPIQGAVFGSMYYFASQAQTKIFTKFSKNHYNNSKGYVRPEAFLHNVDLISKFRFFENGEAQADAQSEIQNYLNVYNTGPMSKAELLNRIADGKPVDPEFASKFKIKRRGRDKDDIFWRYGKIHGLENLAFATEEELNACNGDPMQVQRLADRINDREKPLPPQTFDKVIEQLHETLEAYKRAVDDTGGKEYNPSDRKKLLSLPFLLNRTIELPEPKRGQKEWEAFTELYGKEWDTYAHLQFDQEEKITEFNYENYLPQQWLKTQDTSSPEFKNLIREMNFNSKTQYEAHKENQDHFKQLMPMLSQLDEEETRILFHMIKNKSRDVNSAAQRSVDLIDEACSDEQAKRLAKVSEEANFAIKNRYNHEKQTMKYADKSRMPIEKSKVRDMLRNQHIFKHKIQEEVGTYREWNENTQFESGVLTYVNEAAWGDLRELLNDIGVNRQTIRYSNVGDQIKAKDNRMSDSDANWRNLVNARFTMVDMTDYEYQFPSVNEVGTIPMSNISALLPLKGSMAWPQSNALIEINKIEGLPLVSTSRTHREMQETRLAEAEAEDEEEEEDEDEDDEDEDEEGEEGEEGEDGEGEEEEEEEDDEGEEEVDPMAVPDDVIARPAIDDRYFMHNETIRGKFNEVEIDGFMKLLDINPHTQWEDDTTHHYKVGLHSYEDESQETDPYFYLLAEVERKHLLRQQAYETRLGTEVKIMGDPKKRPNFSRN